MWCLVMVSGLGLGPPASPASRSSSIPDEAFGDRVRARCLDWGAEDADIGAGEHGVEGGSELGISVADQELELLGAVAEVDEQVASLLGDPGAGGMGGDPGEVNAAAAVLDHDQHVEGAQEDGVDVGEDDREDRLGLRGKEVAPGRAGPLRGPVDARALKDPPHRGRGDLVAEADRVGIPTWGSPGPPAAPAPARVARWVVGPGVVAGRSSGGRRAGRAIAAACVMRPAGVGVAGWAAAWPGR